MKTVFVFVPGMWDPKGSFDLVTKHLKALGYSSFVVEDDHQNYQQGFDYYLKRLVSFVRKVKSRNEDSKIILVGHCVGLPLCLKAAEITGIVSGVVNLSGAPFKIDRSWGNVWNFRYLFGKIARRPFRYLFPIIFGNKMEIHDLDMGLLTRTVQVMKDWGPKREPSSGKAVRDLMKGIPVNLAKIPPVFHILCGGDEIISFELQEKLLKKLGGSCAFLVSCGHWAQLENPYEVASCVSSHKY